MKYQSLRAPNKPFTVIDLAKFEKLRSLSN